MKIVYVADVRLPTKNAHGIQIMKMCEAFTRNGHDVELVVPRRCNTLSDDPFEFYGVAHTFQIRHVPCVDLSGRRYIPETVVQIVRLFSFLTAVYHAHMRGALSYDMLYTREQFAGIWFRDFVYELHTPESVRDISRFAWSRASLFVAITRHIRDELVRKSVNAEKIVVAPDGVDLHDYVHPHSKEEARKIIGIPQDRYTLVYSGNFKKWKGVGVIIKALPMLPRDCTIVFVGGTKESDIAALKEATAGDSRVVIRGYQPHSMVPDYLWAADVLILPNTKTDETSEYFTSPLKLFEYMASLRPIIASDVSSTREIVGDDDVFFFEADNAESFVEAVVRCRGDQREADLRAARCREKVARYTWEKRAQQIIDAVLKTQKSIPSPTGGL